MTGPSSGHINNILVIYTIRYERSYSIDALSEVFQALADPTRRAILARLADGDANVGELAAPFAISQPAISRHLKVLEDAGLISRHRQATQRYSHLEADRLKEASDWLTRYREFWEERYSRLDNLLTAIQNEAASTPGPTIEGDPS